MRAVFSSLNDECKAALEKNMLEWQQRRGGASSYSTGGGSAGNDSSVTIPLSQGEWDEGLGLPLCVVCHSVCAEIKTYSCSFKHHMTEGIAILIAKSGRPTRLRHLKWNRDGGKRNLISSYSSCVLF